MEYLPDLTVLFNILHAETNMASGAQIVDRIMNLKTFFRRVFEETWMEVARLPWRSMEWIRRGGSTSGGDELYRLHETCQSPGDFQD